MFLKNTFPRQCTLDGLKVVVDCANGAGYRVGPEVFAELGATVIAMGDEPDGTNINRDCGALHPQDLAARVRAAGAHIGVALDGDADRVILVDEQGDGGRRRRGARDARHRPAPPRAPADRRPSSRR